MHLYYVLNYLFAFLVFNISRDYIKIAYLKLKWSIFLKSKK